MIEDVAIEIIERPGQELIHALESGLNEYNKARTEPHNATPFAIFMKNAAGDLAGGLFAVAFWSGLAIDLFWIAEDFRGLGYGSKLLARAEEEGRRRGARVAFLNTYTFQAPGFYEKHGYELYGELKDFPPGYDRRYYVKSLDPITTESGSHPSQ